MHPIKGKKQKGVQKMAMMECSCCHRLADSRSFQRCCDCGAPLCDDCASRNDGLCNDCYDGDRY